MEKTDQGLRILSSRIFFKAYTADYQDVRPDLAAQNIQRLDDMAAKLKKFPNYKIKLVGHAVMIHWDNKRLGAIEQQYVLLPLSKPSRGGQEGAGRQGAGRLHVHHGRGRRLGSARA